MKFSTTLISAQAFLSAFAEAAIFFDPDAVKLSCDDSITNAIATPGVSVNINNFGVDTTNFNQTILLKPIPASTANNGTSTGTMCILSSWTTPLDLKEQGQGYYLPLGKSVDGRDWDRPPGKGGREIEYLCGEAGNSGTNFDEGDYLCEATLPMTSKILGDGTFSEFNAAYFMTYFERSSTVRNELSRFLQKTTFGPTSDELDALESAFADIMASASSQVTHSEAMTQLQTEWTAAQMDPSTFSTGKFTSLREYWRKRLNPRTAETYRIGESGPPACDKNSRWRKYAFTHNDVQNALFLRWGNIELGEFFTEMGMKNQGITPHVVTVETVEYYTEAPTPSPTISAFPTSSPTVSGVPSSSLAPSHVPTNSVMPSSSVPTASPNVGDSAAPVSFKCIISAYLVLFLVAFVFIMYFHFLLQCFLFSNL